MAAQRTRPVRPARTLFDGLSLVNPVAHAHDPETSRAAAQAVTQSGSRQRNADLVLTLVTTFPGRTAIELWQCADEGYRHHLREPQEVRRRLTDLKAAGLVVQGAARKCGVRGTRMVTWTVSGEAAAV